MLFLETRSGLPYSLWALSDYSGWLGSLAVASLLATIGMICASLAHLPAPLADAAGLWREQSTVLSDVCGRGSGDSKRGGKERRPDVLKVVEPSSGLAGARDGRSPWAGDRNSRPYSPRAALDASWKVSVAVYVDQCGARP